MQTACTGYSEPETSPGHCRAICLYLLLWKVWRWSTNSSSKSRWQSTVSCGSARWSAGLIHYWRWWCWEAGALLCTYWCIHTTAHTSTVATKVPEKCRSRQLRRRKLSTASQQTGLWGHNGTPNTRRRQPCQLPADVICSTCSKGCGSRQSVLSNAGFRSYSRTRRATDDDIQLVKHWSSVSSDVKSVYYSPLGLCYLTFPYPSVNNVPELHSSFCLSTCLIVH